MAVRDTQPLPLADLVIGVDGGGSKTVAWLDQCSRGQSNDPLGRGEAGPSNPGVAGTRQTLAMLDQAIDAAFTDAGVPPGRVAAACLAISGTERSAHRAAILQWADDRSLATHVQLTHDADAVLASGPRPWGVALIAGTGSFAFARDLQGLTVRVGGWGYLFGDEGSGHALGVAALRAVAQAADGRGPATSLLPHVLDACQVTEPRELTRVLYSGPSAGEPQQRHALLAQLAPLVTAEAEAGDDVALQLADEAARDLARLVVAACDQLKLPPHRFPLAIAGSVVCQSPLMRARLEAALAERDHLTSAITLVPQPARGAVELARRAVEP